MLTVPANEAHSSRAGRGSHTHPLGAHSRVQAHLSASPKLGEQSSSLFLVHGDEALEVSTEKHLHPQQSRAIIWAVLTGAALPSRGAAGQREPAIASKSCDSHGWIPID